MRRIPPNCNLTLNRKTERDGTVRRRLSVAHHESDLIGNLNMLLQHVIRLFLATVTSKPLFSLQLIEAHQVSTSANNLFVRKPYMFEFVSRFVRRFHNSKPSRHRPKPLNRRLSLEALDPLLMMSVTPIQTVSSIALGNVVA